MKVSGIRYCAVSTEAQATASFLDALGLPQRPIPECSAADAFAGAIFPTGETSWIEVWPEGPAMPAGGHASDHCR